MVDREQDRGREEPKRQKLIDLLRATGQIMEVAEGKEPSAHEYLDGMTTEKLQQLSDIEHEIANLALGNTSRKSGS